MSDDAIRFTANSTNSYIWPARHLTSGTAGVLTSTPPMGARFRLKASYDISGFAPEMQIILQAMKTYGPDSFVGRLSCILQGSTDTTFYILAVYFGSVNIKFTRHAAACGLLADLVGTIAAIVIAYIFFG